MTIPKRDKRRKKRERVKALSLPPANKAILEPVEIKQMRQCSYDLCKTDSVYCPRCGRVTIKGKPYPP